MFHYGVLRNNVFVCLEWIYQLFHSLFSETKLRKAIWNIFPLSNICKRIIVISFETSSYGKFENLIPNSKNITNYDWLNREDIKTQKRWFITKMVERSPQAVSMIVQGNNPIVSTFKFLRFSSFNESYKRGDFFQVLAPCLQRFFSF